MDPFDGIRRSATHVALLREALKDDEKDDKEQCPGNEHDSQWLEELGYYPGATVELHGLQAWDPINKIIIFV